MGTIDGLGGRRTLQRWVAFFSESWPRYCRGFDSGYLFLLSFCAGERFLLHFAMVLQASWLKMRVFLAGFELGDGAAGWRYEPKMATNQ